MSRSRGNAYHRIGRLLRAAITPPTPLDQRLALIVDAIWEEFGHHQPVSWVGFYRLGENEMTLGYRRDKPACSPIGLHGACGQAARAGQSLVIPDVRALESNYIACDPRDLAELVVPVRDSTGNVIGVLDLDSYTPGAFDLSDQIALEQLVAEFLSA